MYSEQKSYWVQHFYSSAQLQYFPEKITLSKVQLPGAYAISPGCITACLPNCKIY